MEGFGPLLAVPAPLISQGQGIHLQKMALPKSPQGLTDQSPCSHAGFHIVASEAPAWLIGLSHVLMCLPTFAPLNMVLKL